MSLVLGTTQRRGGIDSAIRAVDACPKHQDEIKAALLQTELTREQILSVLSGLKVDPLSAELPGDLKIVDIGYTGAPHDDLVVVDDVIRPYVGKGIDYPVREACKMLFERNIFTDQSGANFVGVGGVAYITMKGLSDENLEILSGFGCDRARDWGDGDGIIMIPVDLNTTVADVKNAIEEMASALGMQPLIWGYQSYDVSDLHSPTSVVEIANREGSPSRYPVYCCSSHNVFRSVQLFRQFWEAVSSEQRQEAFQKNQALKASGAEYYDRCLKLSRFSFERAGVDFDAMQALAA